MMSLLCWLFGHKFIMRVRDDNPEEPDMYYERVIERFTCMRCGKTNPHYEVKNKLMGEGVLKEKKEVSS